jgi:hypothetical protein
MPRKPEATASICPVCGEMGQVYAYGEQVVNTGAHGVDWVLSQGVCKGCLSVVVQAAKDGTLDSLEGG